MRFYSFINCYLSSIQQGIQTAHLVSEIMHKPNNIGAFNKDFINDWAENHKTIIVCNGGNNKTLTDMICFLEDKHNRYPWVTFEEDEDSLEGVLTGVGIVLPEEIYDTEYDSGSKVYSSVKHCVFYTSDIGFEYQLIDRVKSAKLAC